MSDYDLYVKHYHEHEHYHHVVTPDKTDYTGRVGSGDGDNYTDDLVGDSSSPTDTSNYSDDTTSGDVCSSANFDEQCDVVETSSPDCEPYQDITQDPCAEASSNANSYVDMNDTDMSSYDVSSDSGFDSSYDGGSNDGGYDSSNSDTGYDSGGSDCGGSDGSSSH
jgi:hypothetical protein